MPKAPILTRTLYHQRLEDGTIHLLHWNLVSTSLGVMVEPRTINRSGTGDSKNEDLYDSSFTDLAVVPSIPTGNYAFDQVVFGSSQWPRLRANDPGVE